jgi:hypothetical protein
MEWYVGMAVFTATWIWLHEKPRGPKEWAALVGLSIAWPAVVAFTAYQAVRKAGRR